MPKTGGKTPQRKPKVVAFGRVLERARGKLTLGQVAIRVGCSTSYLHQLEHGTVLAPDPVFLEALAGLYGLSFISLVRLLAWNRLHQGAQQAPQDIVEEGEMRVVGEDRYFVEKFRRLPSDRRHQVLELMDLYAGTEVTAVDRAAFRRKARKA